MSTSVPSAPLPRFERVDVFAECRCVDKEFVARNTKYRRKCFSEAILDRLKAIVLGLCEDWDAELIEMNGEADHVHLLLGLNPKCAPSTVANNFKTVTSRLLRKEFPALRKRYSQPVLWSRSYFVATVGGAPLAVIKQYIEQQERPQ